VERKTLHHDIGDLFDFGLGDGMMGALKHHGIAAGSGLAALVAFEAGFERIPLPNALQKPWVMPLAEAAAGAILGPLVGHYNTEAGTGIGVALTSAGGKRLLQGLMPKLFPAQLMPSRPRGLGQRARCDPEQHAPPRPGFFGRDGDGHARHG
jgi:hypothetical protein